MANILNHNRHNIKLIPNYDEYWDFFLNKDCYVCYNFDGSKLNDKCLISYIDTSLFECVDEDWLVSTKSYEWEGAVSTGQTMYNIGYTGVDNGLIRFMKDRITNDEFIKIYSESEFSFVENDFRLKLHAISGNTKAYQYPLKIENGLARCNGGFFQGVVKTDCDKYQILPTNVTNEIWNFEFVLKKEDFEKESEKTLNDRHPNNKGMFFYLGLRAENKWQYLYDDNLDITKDMNADDYADYDGMDCEPGKFLDVDWYEKLETWAVEPITNYVDYIYYPSEMYQTNEYFEDYLETDEKPLIINDRQYAKTLGECCSCKAEKEIIVKKVRCCGCNKCIPYTITRKAPIKNCDTCLFGDDYLADIDEMEYDTDYLVPETDLDLIDFQTAKYGLSLLKFRKYTSIFTDNKFLLFHRCGTGYTVGNWIEDTIVEYRQRVNDFKGNLFLMMDRTCTGYNVHTMEDLKECYSTKYNIYNDLYNNALGFRITDKGELGYRYLSVDCDLSGDDKTKIYEGYSKENVIKDKQWHMIHVKVYGGTKTMFFKFYVDGKLKYITDELPLLNLRKMVEEDEKQELVPFNISLGGGTQGLCDVIMPNYMKVYENVFPLEENFGGTFIGYIKVFRWYNCNMEIMDIRNNFNFEKLNLR